VDWIAVQQFMSVGEQRAHMSAGTTVAFVARSAVRTEVLRAVAAEPRSGDALVAALDSSKSGVYKSINELAERELICLSDGDGSAWEVTGAGRLVADELDCHRWVETLLGHREYWLTHDVSVLPERFRRRLPELRNADLLRNPENDPRYLERYWVERMPAYEKLWVGSRVFHEAYGGAMDDQAQPGEGTRLITHAPLVDERPAAVAESIEARPDEVDQRVCEIPCSFMLTEELFTLSLPFPDGQYDQDSVLIGEDEAALRFGEEFFALYWERGTPIRSYLTEPDDI
jgi:predicted transcriptional regulator